MSIEPIQNAEIDIDTDESGGWGFTLPTTGLKDGLHTVVVTDESGENQDVAFFSVATRESVRYIERAYDVTPTWMIQSIVFFLAVIVILTVYNIRLAWVRRNEKVAIKNRLNKYAVILSLVAVFCSVAVGGLIVYNLNQEKEKAELSGKGQVSYALEMPQVTLEKLTGSVIDPVTDQLVQDVTLRHNDVTISTKDGGGFVFSNIRTDELIYLKHDKLISEFALQVPRDGTLYVDWLFNLELYQLMDFIAQAEADGKVGLIYDKLSYEVQNKISVTDFIQDYDNLYRDSIRESVITMKDASRLTDWVSSDGTLYPVVYRMTLVKDDYVKPYYLVYANLTWQLVE